MASNRESIQPAARFKLVCENEDGTSKGRIFIGDARRYLALIEGVEAARRHKKKHPGHRPIVTVQEGGVYKTVFHYRKNEE